MKSNIAFFAAALFLATAQSATAQSAAAQEERTLVLCGRLIDGNADQPLANAAIVVEGDRIVRVVEGPHRRTVPAARTVDLGAATCLPGLIDAHSHPLISGDTYQTDHLRWSSAYKALRGLKAVQANLHAGWTTLRVAGDADVYYAHLELRRAIDEGLFVGPRLTGAGHYISVTGGGGDLNRMSPEQRFLPDGLIVDGPGEMLRAVREEIKNGSDWIKLLVTGAFMSQGDRPEDVHFSPEELAAAVAEAERRGVPVMAHAHATAGIKMAVAAGVRSIEHGTFLDREAMELMAARGTYLVPTIYIGEYYLTEGAATDALPKMTSFPQQQQREFTERVGEAHRAGVKIAVGSDFGGYPAHLNARELKSLVDAGLTAMEAIQAGTRVGAELLGWDDKIGTVEAGKLADVVAVAGDPLADLSELERVIFVMIGGRIVKRPGGPSAHSP